MATFRARNSGNWQTIIRLVGIPPISRTFKNKSDAQLWAKRTEAEIYNGNLTIGLNDLRRLSLATLIERYRDTVSINKRGHRQERALLNALLRRPFAKLSLSAVTPHHFASYRDSRLVQVRASTINHELTLLNQIFRIAKAEWSIPVNNPIEGLSRPKSSPSRTRRLNGNEFTLLMDAVASCRNPHIKPVILFAIETGMRRSEILRIEWANIDLNNRTLSIDETKNGSPRIIALTQSAAEVLAEQHGKGLCQPFPLSIESFHMAWKRLMARSDIKNLHFHDLRHEAISRFFEKGLSVPEVALISGHKDYRMLARYTHLRAEDVAKKL